MLNCKVYLMYLPTWMADFYGQCRYFKYTLHGWFENYMILLPISTGLLLSTLFLKHESSSITTTQKKTTLTKKNTSWRKISIKSSKPRFFACWSVFFPKKKWWNFPSWKPPNQKHHPPPGPPHHQLGPPLGRWSSPPTGAFGCWTGSTQWPTRPVATWQPRLGGVPLSPTFSVKLGKR